eukprot:1148558-Pelagomonas_calceolata.AAC.3
MGPPPPNTRMWRAQHSPLKRKEKPRLAVRLRALRKGPESTSIGPQHGPPGRPQDSNPNLKPPTRAPRYVWP